MARTPLPHRKHENAKPSNHRSLNTHATTMSTPMSTVKWFSKKERKPLQQRQLTPLNFELHKVRAPPKWECHPSTPTPTKQRRLDDLFAGSTMPRRTTNTKIKLQVDKNTGHNKHHDSIETVSDISSIKRERNPEDKGTKSSSLNRRRNKRKLELSPTRASPRIQAQKSNLVPKYSLPLTDSPPLPVPRESRPITTLPPLSRPMFNPSLSISTRENPYSQNRSTAEPAPSYHTTFSSPINTSQDSAESVMGTREDSNASESERLVNQKEIPSSIPWENTPSDGPGDAWPSSQSDSSPTKRSYSKSSQRSQPRYEDGFRVPDPPSSRMSLDSTQDESQACLGMSPPKAHTQPGQNNPFRAHDRLNWIHPGLADTQDESQPDTHAPQSSLPTEHNAFSILRTSSFSKINLDDTQDLTQAESEREIPRTERKRKREPTINEIPDSAPLNDILQSPKSTDLSLEDSCVILSQAPRKKTPEIINVHSTQSQSQVWIHAPGPRPTSQDLSKPFGRNDSGDSSVSSTSQPSHKWESSQVTQSPIPSGVELSSVVNPPSQPLLSSQNDWSRIPVPLAMTLEYGFPRKPLDLPDLNKMETELELNLQK